MITIYGRDDCQPCKATVRFCNQNGIDYEYIDVDMYPDAHAKIAQRGIRSLPFCEVDDDYWTGFRPDKLTKHG